MGKPYVQVTDPSLTNNVSVNDIWLNQQEGSIKLWNGATWVNMQWGESAIMDDCIANRVIADNISANKITTGVLQSQDGSFALNLSTGEAKLLKLMMGGQVEGNVFATSFNGLTRVRLRGREGEKKITAGLVFESREKDGDEVPWENSGQIFFDYNTRASCCTFQRYQIGKYNASRPSLAYNAGSADGLLWKAIDMDWLRTCNLTYHGVRLMKRDSADDSFEDINPVITGLGNVTNGTRIVSNGTVTCTYKMNDIMQIDFNIRITTSGSGSSEYGISRNLLRQLNAEIPVITPLDGGTIQIFNSSGNLVTTYIGATFAASGVYWKPSYVSSGAITDIPESALTSGMTLVGTCYGKYDFNFGE